MKTYFVITPQTLRDLNPEYLYPRGETKVTRYKMYSPDRLHVGKKFIVMSLKRIAISQ